MRRPSSWKQKITTLHQKQGQYDTTVRHKHGQYDGAETCELVGSYLLSQLSVDYSNDIGLYRDDGLAAFDESPHEIENIKKHICKVFYDHQLKLTIDASKKCVEYLDITLDLRSSSYKPYMKPGNSYLYVNCSGNHSLSILQSIPEAINKRLLLHEHILRQTILCPSILRGSAKEWLKLKPLLQPSTTKGEAL